MTYVAPSAWAAASVCLVLSVAAATLGKDSVAYWRTGLVIALLAGAIAHLIVVFHGVASRDFPAEYRHEIARRHYFGGGLYAFWRAHVKKD